MSEQTDEYTAYTDAGFDLTYPDDERAMAVIEAPHAPTHQQPRTFSDEQLALIQSTVAAGTSQDEFRLFIEVCKLTGLNPFAKQIYAIMRSAGKDAQGHWVKRMTIQTGIDGYRLMAARTGELAGIDDPTYDTEDGAHPNRATVTVYRLVAGQRMPFVATARWREYAALDKDSNPTNLWAKMPWLMLGKCSEALALRKAFPAELSGVYAAEEMAQADNPAPPQPELHNFRAEQPTSAPERPQAPQNTRSTAAPTPASPRPQGDASTAATAAGEWRVGKYDPIGDKATRNRLTALGYRSVSQVEEFLTAVRQAGDYTERSIKQAVVALEQQALEAAKANGYDLQASGAFADAMPN